MSERSTGADATGEATRTSTTNGGTDASASPSERSATPATPANEGVAQLSYEQAREELVAVVSRLEAGGATLEESLSLWERGEALAARCEQWLHGAQQRLDAARPQQEQSTGH